MTKTILIGGANVINVHTGTKEAKDILISGEKIIGMGAVGSLDTPKGTKKIDAVGLYAIPGLWDAHIHMTTWPEYTSQLSQLLIANGITSVRDMGGQIETVAALREHNRQPDVVAPRMWIAGPIIDGPPQLALGYGVEVDTPEEATNLIDSLVEQGVDFVKAYELLRPEVFRALMRQAQHHHLPAAGHIPQRMSIREVLELGPYDLQHLGGTCAGMKYDCVTDGHPMPDRTAILDARTPNESGGDLMMKVCRETHLTPEDMDPEKIAALIQLFVEKGTWHTPTLTTCVTDNEVGFTDDSYMTDAIRYLPEPRRKYARELRNPTADPTNVYKFVPWKIKVVNQMHKAGVKFLAGTDSPPVHTPGFALHMELKALVVAGLSPLDALKTATLNPAEFFSITEDFGSIEVGKFADMVLLDKDPTIDIDHCRCINSVLSRGQFFDRAALDALLTGIAEQQKSPA